MGRPKGSRNLTPAASRVKAAITAATRPPVAVNTGPENQEEKYQVDEVVNTISGKDQNMEAVAYARPESFDATDTETKHFVTVEEPPEIWGMPCQRDKYTRKGYQVEREVIPGRMYIMWIPMAEYKKREAEIWRLDAENRSAKKYHPNSDEVNVTNDRMETVERQLAELVERYHDNEED